MFSLYMPTRVCGGIDVLQSHAGELTALGSRCLIVTGRHAARASGALDDLTAILKQHGIGWEVFDEIEPNPTVTSCYQAAARAKLCGAEFVVGIGGGSPLDAAKIVAMLATNDLTVRELYDRQWKYKPLPTVCIGTTAGTGSEVTRVSVLTTDGRKRSITDDGLYPVLSFCDPRYTATCDLPTTMTCAMDALCHALEGYFSAKADPLTDSIAISAAHKLSGALVELTDPRYGAGGLSIPMELRDTLYTGAMQAGMVLNTCGAGFPHTMGYLLTEEFRLPHGYACAAFLPAYLEQAARHCPGKVQALGIRLDKLSAFLQSSLPTSHIRMSDDYISDVCARFEGNKNFRNSPGQPDAAFAGSLLRKLFCDESSQV